MLLFQASAVREPKKTRGAPPSVNFRFSYVFMSQNPYPSAVSRTPKSQCAGFPLKFRRFDFVERPHNLPRPGLITTNKSLHAVRPP